MKRLPYILLLSLALTACSTQKNTVASRAFHQLKVKYNIFYNGNVAYEEGLRSIQKAHTDDYTAILPLYPVSDHQAAASATSQMDLMIEKCRKCIKLHSIKAKPKPDPKKRSNPEYKLWLQQEEFNKHMGDVWVRLAEAEFHKADFLGAIGTLSYVIKHYQYDPDIIARCQLLMARAYAELGWIYEAEDYFNKTESDNLDRRNAHLYAATGADIMLKSGRYKEAAPFIKLAMPAEKRKIYRPRFQYILAQIYELGGRTEDASDAYRRVIRMSPEPDMEFNARIHRAQLKGKSAIHQLLTMTKQSKYKDKLDQLYGAVGNIYLARRDTAKALDYYQLAIDKSTQAKMPKAQVLIQAGDIYFGRQEYTPAQPCYQEAATIISVEHADYDRIKRRSETLDELIKETAVITLQDSLQQLSRLSEAEQRAVAEKIVEDLIAAEQQAQEDALIAEREQAEDGLMSVNTSRMFGMNGSGEWYFYNTQLIKNGAQEFRRKWGSRKLEDNWRRVSKAAVSTPLATEETDELALEADSLSADSLPAIAAVETDTHKPEYYLQQIPKTEADIALSDSLIANALYNLVFIYKDNLQDTTLALQTMQELQNRFPDEPRLLDLYYMWYLSALKNRDEAGMAKYRALIMSAYPTSAQAQIVSDPAYFDKLRHMAVEQDSVYELTYAAYKKSQFAAVKKQTSYARTTYPLSPLMPRFLFLNAVAVARTEGQEAFISCLKEMVAQYPEHSLSAMAKDFLAMMGQGMESQQGALSSDLDQLRGQTAQQEQQQEQVESFDADTHQPAVVLLAMPSYAEAQMNTLLYEVALFNFTQFLIKDFDLRPMPVFGEGSALRICGFDSLEEALWYIGLTKQNTELTNQFVANQVTIIPITENNAALLNTRFTVEEYSTFLKKNGVKMQ